ncbi:hypothetical protein SESBI_07165 [Sesbania bispinosa]|nr:hypothetical protein SESBI_07165 [Sesbania bispinosa]
MGGAMAYRLLSTGYTLSFYARNPSHPNSLSLLSQGSTLSPSHLAQSCDVVFTMLGHHSDICSILLYPYGVVYSLHSNSITVDAPISGGDISTRDGKLTILATGEELVVEWLKPLFDILGKAT